MCVHHQRLTSSVAGTLVVRHAAVQLCDAGGPALFSLEHAPAVAIGARVGEEKIRVHPS